MQLHDTAGVEFVILHLVRLLLQLGAHSLSLGGLGLGLDEVVLLDVVFDNSLDIVLNKFVYNWIWLFLFHLQGLGLISGVHYCGRAPSILLRTHSAASTWQGFYCWTRWKRSRKPRWRRVLPVIVQLLVVERVRTVMPHAWPCRRGTGQRVEEPLGEAKSAFSKVKDASLSSSLWLCWQQGRGEVVVLESDLCLPAHSRLDLVFAEGVDCLQLLSFTQVGLQSRERRVSPRISLGGPGLELDVIHHLFPESLIRLKVLMTVARQ